MTEKLPPTTQALALADQLMKAHEAVLVGIDGSEVRQTMMLMKAGEPAAILPCTWGSDEERLIMLRSLRAVVALAQPDLYAFWCEAWVAQYANEEAAAKRPPRTKDDPNSFEVVATYVVERGHRPVHRTQRIERGYDGVVTKLVPEGIEKDPESIGGPLVSLYDE